MSRRADQHDASPDPESPMASRRTASPPRADKGGAVLLTKSCLKVDSPSGRARRIGRPSWSCHSLLGEARDRTSRRLRTVARTMSYRKRR